MRALTVRKKQDTALGEPVAGIGEGCIGVPPAMVMEASPSPQSVGREFVRQYYTLLNKAPAHLHRFYNNYSSFVHGGLDAPNRETLPVVGQKQIHNRIQQLNFRDCHAKISQVDAQATLGGGVVVQVTGELSNGGAPMRRFTQTFVLAAQSPKKYYVHNDIFRYQDLVCSDDSAESGRSEAEDEEPGVPAAAYFPPPPPAAPAPASAPPAPSAPAPFPAPPAAPAPFPAPPAAPAPAPLPSPPPPPHVAHVAAQLNGHPQAHDDSTRHLVAALQGSTLGHSSVECEPEPEPAGGEPAPEPAEPPREPTPQPDYVPVAAIPSPPEPKTYANLLKSGPGGGGCRVTGPPLPPPPALPASAPPAAAPSSAPAPAPHPPAEPRPPRVRPPPHQHSQPPLADGITGAAMGPSPGNPSTRRYSDAQQLFLGNLPHSATEDALRVLFSRFGVVAELRVHSKPAAAGAPRHPNYGFITYESSSAARECLAAQPLYFPENSPDGVKLNVEEKKARGGRDPRDGRDGRDGPPPRRRPLSSARAPRPNAYRR